MGASDSHVYVYAYVYVYVYVYDYVGLRARPATCNHGARGLTFYGVSTALNTSALRSRNPSKAD